MGKFKKRFVSLFKRNKAKEKKTNVGEEWFKDTLTNAQVKIKEDTSLHTSNNDMYLLFYLKDSFSNGSIKFQIIKKYKQHNRILIQFEDKEQVKTTTSVSFSNYYQERLIKKQLDYTNDYFYLFNKLEINKWYETDKICIKYANEILERKEN